uniref:Uncharacterized protein n=1 Tax=Arundo donax TaxID=35708 RepID=A0A0A9AX91_ARUDO
MHVIKEIYLKVMRNDKPVDELASMSEYVRLNRNSSSQSHEHIFCCSAPVYSRQFS